MAKLLSSSEVKGAPTPEERPTMKQLQEVMRIKDIDIATRWRDLGLELVDSNKVLRVIEANHPSDVDSCCRVMFEKWLEMTPDASWSQLVAALNNIGMKTAADAVSKLLKSDSANTSNVTSAINFSDCGNISAAFTLLTTKIYKLLKSADFDALQTAVLQQRNTPKGVQFPDHLFKSITSAQNLGTLLKVLVTDDSFRHWNWADLRLLETLVISSDNHAAKVIIDQYKESIFPIKLSEVLDKLPIPQNKEHRDAYTAKVASKIQKEPSEVTVGDLSYYCNILETVIMDINNCSCVLEHLDDGCLEIHWLIPTHCRFHAYKSALNNRHKFCDIHLQYLHIEPYPLIYDPFTIQPTILSTLLRLPKPIVSTPAEVIGHYYCFLSDNLDNSVVCKIMLKLKVVNEEDLIHCAKLHSEYQKNAFLLDRLLVTNKFSNFFEFCHLLHNTDNQQEFGYMLVNALKLIPVNNMDAGQSSDTSSQSEDGANISPVYQPEVFLAAKTVHIRFLNLVTQLRQNLKVSDPKSFLAACNKLSASASHLKPIPLLEVGYLQDLDDASSEEIFNRLAILWTWNNCSILRALLETSDDCQDGIKILDDFASQIDVTQPMELFPIPPPSMKMAPSLSSPFTVLSIRKEYDRDEPVPLQYVNDVATIMTEKFGISSHASQLLAARANPLMLYWMIPKSIIPIISEGVNEHLDFLKENGLSEIAAYPNNILFVTDNLSHGSFAFLSTQPQSVGVTEEVVFLEDISDDVELKQIYKQNTDLKAEVTRLKSSENNLTNELKKLTEKYISLSQDFEKSTFISKAEGIMDQLEETMSKLPLFKKYKNDKDEESVTLSDHDEIERPPAFLNRMQIFAVEFEEMKDFYHLEADLPSKVVKIKQLEDAIGELQSELEMKSKEIDRLKKENKTLIDRFIQQKASNEKDSEVSLKPFVHDDAPRSRNENNAVITSLKEMEDSKEREPLVLPKPLQGDRPQYLMSMTMQIESSLGCPICANRFTVDGPLQPKILKCGHTLCTNCIWQTSKTEIYQIKCSLCFGITPIGALGIYALPINRTLVNILSNMNLQESLEAGTTPVDLCCYCNEKPAEKICFGCDPTGCKLCNQCCDAEHNRPFAPVKAHKPLNINEVTNIPRNFCVKHDQLLTHYSEKAVTYACKKCLAELDDSVDVEFLPMEAGIQMLRQRLPKVMEDLENYLKRLQDAQRKMEMIQGQLGVSKSKAMQEIMKKFSKYQIIFQERQKTLLANLEAEVNNRRKSLELQIINLRRITSRVLSYKKYLQALMQKDRREFLFKYWDTQKDINDLLNNEDFSLQRPVAIPDISVYISDNFEGNLQKLGSVGGGPVIDLNAAMHVKGLLRLTWGLPKDGEDIEGYEVEYSTWLPLSVKQTDVTRVDCDGRALWHFVNAICPGYTYQFRIRCRSVSGWGMWSKSIVSKFDDFPCTIGFISKIVTIQIPSAGHYRITAKGAKAADSDRFKGGKGAIISAIFLLQKGDLLEILCGGMSECQNCHSGGAGGTFVAVNNRHVSENLLLVAGGGGGTRGYDDHGCDGCDASLEPNGTSTTAINCAEGGMNGAPGKDANFLGPSWGHGGAGWQHSSSTAKSFVDGGDGGECGGFGGGGGVGMYGGGGGGGFSGGGGGRGGGGGGSYIRGDGYNVTKEIGNVSHGEVEITRISSPPNVTLNKSTSSSNNNSRELMVLSMPISQQSSTGQIPEMADPQTTSNNSTKKQLSTSDLSLSSNNSEHHLSLQ